MRMNEGRLAARRGTAYVAAIAFMTVLTAVAAAMVSMADMELQKSNNSRHAQQARMAAESGLDFLTLKMKAIYLPHETKKESILSYLYPKLQYQLEGTGNLDSNTLTLTTGAIEIPTIVLPSGSFSSTITRGTGTDEGVWVRCTGRSGEVRRTVSVFFRTYIRRSHVFDYGVASRGKITVSGSGVVTGMNDPGEGRMLSTRGSSPAIEVIGSGTVGGDLYVTGDSEDYIVLGSGAEVAGETDPTVIMDQNVHLDVEDPEFPVVDTSPFERFATNVMDTGSDYRLGSYSNIRIKAGTDPKFSSDTVIRGVMYIEYPNKVRFSGSVQMEGVIVTEEPPLPDLSSNHIKFRGGFTAPGVSALPDTAEYDDLKNLGGTVILAPGFSLDFRGNAGTVNGVIAADQVEFSGSASVGGELEGSILGLTDTELSIDGNSEIKINATQESLIPSGFKHPFGLEWDPNTYIEPID
ncbi:MAG: hypothetical protein ACLFVU_04205 [Phycisphaerae bacterium]